MSKQVEIVNRKDAIYRLTPEIVDTIKDLLTKGSSYKEIAKEIKVPVSTLYAWNTRNKGGIKGLKEQVTYARRLKEAEKVIDVHLSKKSLKASTFVLKNDPNSRYAEKKEKATFNFSKIEISTDTPQDIVVEGEATEKA